MLILIILIVQVFKFVHTWMYITWFCVLDMIHYPIYANRSLIVYNLIKQIMVCYGTKEHFHAIRAQNASWICILLLMFWHVIKTIIAIFTSLPPFIIDKLCFTILTEILGPLHGIIFLTIFWKGTSSVGKKPYFEIVDPPVYFKYVKNIGRKGLTENSTHNSFIEKPIHLRYIFIRQRHMQVIWCHIFHFIPLCKSISCATVYIQKVWMVVHGFHLSCDVFFI